MRVMWYNSKLGPICNVCGATVGNSEWARKRHVRYHDPKWLIVARKVYYHFVLFLDNYVAHSNTTVFPKKLRDNICDEWDLVNGVPMSRLKKEADVRRS